MITINNSEWWDAEIEGFDKECVSPPPVDKAEECQLCLVG